MAPPLDPDYAREKEARRKTRREKRRNEALGAMDAARVSMSVGSEAPRDGEGKVLGDSSSGLGMDVLVGRVGPPGGKTELPALGASLLET